MVAFGVDFGSCWKLLEATFASLRAPGTPLGPWITPGGYLVDAASAQHPHIPPSGRGTWQILGQLGVNWIFPHSKMLFFGGQLGPILTHLGANLGPIWIKIGQEGQLGAIWRQSGGILGHIRQQSLKLTEMCSKNTPKLVFSKGAKY